jgi:hypothetical protein
MQEIKSVRIDNNKNSFNTLFKVTLFRVDLDNFIVIFYKGNNTNRYNYINSLYPQIKKDLFFSGDKIVSGFNELGQFDYFINEAITQQSRIDKVEYVITQDPFLESLKKRRFSLDPYYLNNGAIIYINWLEDGQIIDASEFSDEIGNEQVVNAVRKDIRIKKQVQILYKDDIFTISEKNKIEFDLNKTRKNYSGIILDKLIINEVISIWKSKVINYDLKLCEDQSNYCSEIEYVSPLETKVIEQEKEIIKEKKKMEINLIKKTVKKREDFILKVNVI